MFICMYCVGPPNIIFISNHTVSQEGDKVNLQCIATNDVHASYSLQINWYKEKELITSNGHLLLYNKADKTSKRLKSTLLIDPVSHTDDGKYTCRAFNHPDLFTELKINLTVECKKAKYIIIVLDNC